MLNRMFYRAFSVLLTVTLLAVVSLPGGKTARAAGDDDDAPARAPAPRKTTPPRTTPGKATPRKTTAAKAAPVRKQAVKKSQQKGRKPARRLAPPAAARQAAVVGEWAFVNAVLVQKSGKNITNRVSGELTLRANGTWEQARYIGSIFAGGEGRYVVRGNRITLRHNDGSSDYNYTWHVGRHQHEGKNVTALSLKSDTEGDSWFSYLLVKKEK